MTAGKTAKKNMIKEITGEEVKKRLLAGSFLLGAIIVFGLFALSNNSSAEPDGPSAVDVISNETSTGSSAFMLNVSGGYISTINVTAVTQNPRWKAMVGYVTGKFTLDDAGGSTIYDWTLTSISGEIFATRNSSSVLWNQIKCANTTILETENTELGHTNFQDNVSATFSDSTHGEFFVGSVNISANSCPTLNTYVNNASQDINFEEVILFDGINDTESGNLVFATILEQSQTGFDGENYDFQMIVPEIGTPGFSGATAYYLYVEIS